MLKAIIQAMEVGKRASIDNDGIHIDTKKEYANISTAVSIIGDAAYHVIACSCSLKYLQERAEVFPLKENCIANEIKEHVEAYEWSSNISTTPNMLAWGYSIIHSKEEVYEATKTIDIRISDLVTPGMQAWWFNYHDGLREMYYYSDYDPWSFSRGIYEP